MNGGFAIALVALGALLVVAAIASATGLRAPPPAPYAVVDGDPEAGRVALARNGCGACHAIPGVRGAGGRVGPGLAGLRHRRFLAGRLPNDPENLVRFIVDPQGASPGSSMPNLDVVEAEARQMAAYLATLRGPR
jgi:cytochrome c